MARKKITQDERYHDTMLLLKKYRDVVWSLSMSVEHAKSDFRECFGESIEDFLDSVYVAGADLSGTDIEERAKCIERSNKMLNLVDEAVATMRQKHKNVIFDTVACVAVNKCKGISCFVCPHTFNVGQLYTVIHRCHRLR